MRERGMRRLMSARTQLVGGDAARRRGCVPVVVDRVGEMGGRENEWPRR